MTSSIRILATAFLSGVFTIGLAGAQETTSEHEVDNDPGLVELDRATELRLTADSMADLQRIVRLCESAIKLGIDEENTEYAVELMTAALYEHASRLSQPLLAKQGRDRQRQALLTLALKDLHRLMEIDDTLAAAHILLARLHLLPGGERKTALTAVNRAIELLNEGEDNEQLSQAYVVKSHLASSPVEQIDHLNKAVEIDTEYLDAIRNRGLVLLSQRKYTEAIADFEKILETDPNELTALHGIGEAFAETGSFQQAIEHTTKAIETSPNSYTSYLLRAKIFVQADKPAEALADLDKSIDIFPKNIPGFMARAQLRLQRQEFELALADINRVLELSPQLPQAILFRSVIFEMSNRLHDAINDIDQLLRQNPTNVELQLQLARLYGLDQRPSKAIKLYDDILQQDPANALALRGRADSLLNTGQQAAAIKAYEQALQHLPEDSGILNNLAWVLATSPDDSLRNAERALELASQACTITEFKFAHMLSTLAAAYAELSDFENAIKYSTQAVALANEDEMKTQLQKELTSYMNKQPWREIQNLIEKPDPEPPSPDDLSIE